jgi:hypothetical protein
MGCIDQDIDAFLAQITDKSVNPAKAPAADRNGLSARRRGPAGERQDCLEAQIGCEQPRQRARFRRAAQEKNTYGSRF